jgi:hypothetical protein
MMGMSWQQQAATAPVDWLRGMYVAAGTECPQAGRPCNWLVQSIWPVTGSEPT